MKIKEIWEEFKRMMTAEDEWSKVLRIFIACFFILILFVFPIRNVIHQHSNQTTKTISPEIQQIDKEVCSALKEITEQKIKKEIKTSSHRGNNVLVSYWIDIPQIEENLTKERAKNLADNLAKIIVKGYFKNNVEKQGVVVNFTSGGNIYVYGSPVTTLDIPNLELTEYWIENGEYYDQLVGKVVNHTNKEYNYVEISFDVYDSWGNQIDTCWTNIAGLGAGATWKFKCILPGENISKIELKEIRAY